MKKALTKDHVAFQSEQTLIHDQLLKAIPEFLARKKVMVVPQEPYPVGTVVKLDGKLGLIVGDPLNYGFGTMYFDANGKLEAIGGSWWHAHSELEFISAPTLETLTLASYAGRANEDDEDDEDEVCEDCGNIKRGDCTCDNEDESDPEVHR